MSKARRSSNTLEKSSEARKGRPKVAVIDPVYAAFDDYRQKDKHFDRLYDAMELAENSAAKKLGRRPWGLIAWRRYSAIGGSEIENARDEFLRAPGADERRIAAEYKDAKARQQSAEQAGPEWDRLAGLSEKRRELEAAREARQDSLMKLARTKPTTVAGAAMILAYLKRDIEIGSNEWQEVALGTLVRALKSISAHSNIAA